MFYKIEKIFLYLLIIIFFSVIIFYYFSEENKIKIINNRLGSTEAIENEYSNFPLLNNDTDNVIDYNTSDISNNKIKKRYFWNLLKK